MGTGLGILAADGPDFMIHGLVKFHLFGQELWLTTTHVSVLVVCVLLIIFALIVRSKLRDTEGNLEHCRTLQRWLWKRWTAW